MRARLPFRWVGLCFVAIGSLGAAGDCELFAPPGTDNLPPVVAFVVENEETFLEEDLFGPNGTGIPTSGDDLNTLDGCWGAYRPTPLFSGQRLGGLYFTRTFDRNSGLWETFMLSRVIGIDMLDGTRGSFRVLASDRIEVTRTEYLSPFDEDRNLDPDAKFMALDTPFTEVLMPVLSGDQFILNFFPEVTPVRPQDVVVYTRFECPE